MKKFLLLALFLLSQLALVVAQNNQARICTEQDIPAIRRPNYIRFAKQFIENYYATLLFNVGQPIIQETFITNTMSDNSQRYQPEFLKKTPNHVQHLTPESYTIELNKEFQGFNIDDVTLEASEIQVLKDFYAPNMVSCYVIAEYTLTLKHASQTLYKRKCRAYCLFPSAADWITVRLMQVEPIQDIISYHSKDESMVAVPVRVPVQEENPAPVKVATTGVINGHEYVDLGLSVKWATMNVGATSPGGYDNYFAWGEVHPKSEYTKENSVTYEKYITGSISGNSQYDAARYHWGGSWRLPTKKELEELKEKCRWIWSEENGHSGYTVVGPNGNRIFLPAAGYPNGTSTSYVGTFGFYWSGSPSESYTQGACYLYFYDALRDVGWNGRHYGQSVRPVSE